jgi:hypothetical protein
MKAQKPMARDPRPLWCYAVPLRGGCWGACQVLGVSAEQADVVAFDLVVREPPTLKRLAKAKALALTHHAQRGQLERLYVRGPVPTAFLPIGAREPLIDPATTFNSAGGWTSLGTQVLLQHRWDHVIPKAEKARYRKGNTEVTLGNTTKAVGHFVRVGDTPHAEFHVPADEAVTWSALDGAGCLTELDYTGRDPAVVDYVTSRKLVGKLMWWAHGQTAMDLSASGLRELRIDSARRLSLHVNEHLECLALLKHGRGRSLTVIHPTNGEGLELQLWWPTGHVLPPRIKGLERLSGLDLNSIQVIDPRAIARVYPQLRSLVVRGKYARLEHPAALAKLKRLESLTLYDVYDVDVAALPALAKLPNLRHVTVGGLRKSDAQALKSHFNGLDHLEIYGAKNDAWIAANANNPLRDWVDDDERFGDRACKAFAKAYRTADKAKTIAEVKRALTDFVKALNRLEATFELIDTIRREEAFDAYGQLTALTAVDPKMADGWFDDHRDF